MSQTIELILNLSLALVVLIWIIIGSIKKWKNNPKALFIIILVSLLFITLLIWTYISPVNKNIIRDIVSSFGVFAPISFILLQIIQVIIPPIDHTVMGVMGGLLFGLPLGFVYNLIGRVIGSLIACYIARKFGKKIVSKIISQDDLEKYGKIWNTNKFLIFLVYFAPFFPDDVLSYLAGFSTISLWDFFIIVLLGHIAGSYALAWAGSGISLNSFSTYYILTTIAIILAIILPFIIKKHLKK